MYSESPLKIIRNLLLYLSTFLLVCCTNPKSKYESLKNDQKEVQKMLYQLGDDKEKISLCDKLIDAFDSFTKDYNDNVYASYAYADRIKWVAKRDSLVDVFSSKIDYEAIQKLEKTSEEIMVKALDYSIKMKACDDVVLALEKFLINHKNSSYNPSVTTSLLLWQAKKRNLELEITNLYRDLFSKLKEKASSRAKREHPLSKIEEIILISRNTKSEGYTISVTDVYTLRMKGIIFGKDVFNFSVIVKGNINLSSKEVKVNDEVSVIE